MTEHHIWVAYRTFFSDGWRYGEGEKNTKFVFTKVVLKDWQNLNKEISLFLQQSKVIGVGIQKYYLGTIRQKPFNILCTKLFFQFKCVWHIRF